MRKLFSILSLILPLALTGCFQSEEEKALELVKNGYLEADETATVSQMIDGYSHFNQVTWEYFTTGQGQRIVEAVGTIDLWDGVKVSASIDKAAFKEFVKTAELRMENIIQFSILPNDRFEISYQGQRLTANPDMMGRMSDDMVRIIEKSELSSPRILQSIYSNKNVQFSPLIVPLFNKHMAIKSQARVEARQRIIREMGSLIPGNKHPDFRLAAHYTREDGAAAMLFKDNKGTFFTKVDASSERAACAISGELSLSGNTFSLVKMYDLDGSTQKAPCKLDMVEGEDGMTVSSNCHKDYCGMGAFLNGDYETDLVKKVKTRIWKRPKGDPRGDIEEYVIDR